MKRLKLAAFKAQHQPNNPSSTAQLLGQVLGNCHDDPKTVKKKFAAANSGVNNDVDF